MAITLHDLKMGEMRPTMRRARQRADDLSKAKKKIAKGLGYQVETDARREKAFKRWIDQEETPPAVAQKLLASPRLGMEAFIGARNNILTGEFFKMGLLAARAVCKITCGVETGTGFLVGNGIVLTNHHVIPDREMAAEALFEFLYDDHSIGTFQQVETYMAEPSRFFLAEEHLDFCFIALQEYADAPPLKNFGWLPLIKQTGKILIGDSVNIIQHPQGQKKRVVVHDSVFTFISDSDGGDTNFCWYTGDTQPGASGSPVLNNRWEVVALHHRAIPEVNSNDEVLDVNGKTIDKERFERGEAKVKWIANEGARASRIAKRLKSVTSELSFEEQARRDELVRLWENPACMRLARRASLTGMGPL